MTVEIVGMIAMAFGISSFLLGSSFAIYVFMISTLFGASAALILTAMGGSPISPSHLLLGFLVANLIARSDVWERAARGLAFPHAGFWLCLTAVYGVVSAFFLPRVFAGLTYVFAARVESGAGYTLIPLGPSTGNITQTIYFTADFICFMACYAYASTHNGKKVMTSVVLTWATLNLVFALVDLVTYWTNTTEVLSFIRNSTYRMLNDTEVAGFKRIVGSFSEAAVFATTTLGLFAFTGRLWLCGIYPRFTFTLAALSLCALIFSTSTTGYVGLSALLAIAYLECLIRTLTGRATIQTVVFVGVLPLVISISVIALALNDAYWLYIKDLLNTMVLNKMSTDSGVERTAWNKQALMSFFDTSGFGAGIGSLRASSFLIAVPASIGVIGAVTYGAFLFCVLFGRRERCRESDPFEDAGQQAARAACLACLLSASVAGAFVDLGLIFFIYAGLACGAPRSLQPWAYHRRPELPICAARPIVGNRGVSAV
jgi:hypothetical protein